MEIRFRVPTVRGLRQLATNVAGLGLLSAAAWHGLGVAAGLAAAGVSVLVLGWLSEPRAEEGHR